MRKPEILPGTIAIYAEMLEDKRIPKHMWRQVLSNLALVSTNRGTSR